MRATVSEGHIPGMFKKPIFRALIPAAFLAVVLALVKLATLSTTDPWAFTSAAGSILLIGNLSVQFAALVVIAMTGRSRTDLKRGVSQDEFPGEISEDASKDDAGRMPGRNPHYVRGVAALITSILIPVMWVGYYVAMTFARSQVCAVYGDRDGQCGGMQWLGIALVMLLFAPGAIILTPVTYLRGRDVLRLAGKVYDWPVNPRFSTHPALTVAKTLRQTQLVLLWSWLALLLLQFMG